MTDDDRRHLVLVGLMGVGKTTVGRICAQRLDRPFVDTDDVVTANAGATVAELFEREGEAGFRARERDAVADVCASVEPLVIACGGGAVLDAENRRRLRSSGIVVLLDARPAVLAERVAGTHDRPLLSGDAEATLARLRELRWPAYDAVADVLVDTSGRSAEEVAGIVLEALAEVATDAGSAS